MKRLIVALLALALIATACGSSSDDETAAGGGCLADPGIEAVDSSNAGDRADSGDLAGTSITLATYDSFALSEGTLKAFTDATGIEVTQIAAGDTGQLVSSAVLSKDNPTADVLFGIDNTFLCRGLDAGIFTPYESPALDGVASDLALDPHHRVTPISYGDVCINYWVDAVPQTPSSLDDLTDAAYAGQFVTEDPETSSPGFALLLATVAKYGEDGWERWWEDVAANDLAVTTGWSDAYYGEFVAGGGGRSIVTSYASSPPAEVIFADPPVDTPPTAVIVDSCFRQVEFAGILAGTEHPEASAALIDFMLTPTYQDDIPLNMFVYPALTSATLPTEFVAHTPDISAPLSIDPTTIEANRDAWTARWREIVLQS